MESITVQAIAAFALAVVPGVIVVEILEFPRPRLVVRDRARAFAVYLLISALVWLLAARVGGAEEALVDLVRDGPQGDRLVRAYLSLGSRLVFAAVLTGMALQALRLLANHIGRWLVDVVQPVGRPWLRRLAAIVAAGISSRYAWDSLLARLKRADVPQIARVRLQDGSVVYGRFARGGHADYEAEGRGLLLDRELVEADAGLEEIRGSSGMFIPSDAVVSVSFVADQELSAPELHSKSDG